MAVARVGPQHLHASRQSPDAQPVSGHAVSEHIRLATRGCEMRLRTRNPGRRPAVAALEAALVLPLLFILLFGVWEVSRMIQVAQAVSNAPREGARQASAG